VKYSIDTSSLLDAWLDYYAPDVFPKWWQLFEASMQDGIVRASQAVLLELEKKDDSIHAWMKLRRFFFVPIDKDIQEEVGRIMASYERLVDTRKGRWAADPFVIALAKLNNAHVITSEKPTGVIEKPNIPDVCNAMNVRCRSLLEFMREMKWRID
jgi:hypothetical protein